MSYGYRDVRPVLVDKGRDRGVHTERDRGVHTERDRGGGAASYVEIIVCGPTRRSSMAKATAGRRRSRTYVVDTVVLRVKFEFKDCTFAPFD
ncbi:hypothetical protein [Oryza sativa Japonica Group]|uniref:Uncharacterized protein OSJNBa0049B20.4 n=1 Tax=Oryza sativa subsp. japonica TaxID=39947 RepID=Q9XHY8_ORYSJ|nr:hypothetical protein [Oryza sativa Japonica Group]BAB40066.1 hypothetical protein [Oryza sativa Japonica Group]